MDIKIKSITRDLKRIVGRNSVFTEKEELYTYSYDSTPHRGMPAAVVFPTETGQVAQVVRYLDEWNIPVTPRGAGSGLTGGSIPRKGGVVISLEHMDKILTVDAAARIGYVQAGVVTSDFQKHVNKFNLFYPPDPASADFSTIGGNIAECAGGLTCVKYGVTKSYVAGIIAVDARGNVFKTGVYTPWGEESYDLASLIIGSEGTLAIICEAAIRLKEMQQDKRTLSAFFSTMNESAHAAVLILHNGLVPLNIEFMDSECLKTVERYAGVTSPPDADSLLLVEVDGSTEEVEESIERIKVIIEKLSPIELSLAENEEDRDRLWKLRKSLSPSIAQIAPLKINEDICVPLSRIPHIVDFIGKLRERYQVKIVVFGHAGDGNIHVNFMTHPDNTDEIERIDKATCEMFKETVRVGGTLSGEHGIGITKQKYLGIELGESLLRLESRIKHALDPDDILNPGKILPDS